MRTKLLSLLAFVALSTQVAFTQTSTKGFSFQGYAIDIEGKALASENITVKFTLSSVSNVGSPFQEEHSLTSDAFGVFHAIIGNSSAPKNIEFSKLDFTKKGDDDYTLKVEVKKTSGGTYTTISNEYMNAVPYARKAENGVPVGSVVAFAGDKTNIPSGWLACDGTEYNATDYPQLYGAIAEGWGSTSTGTKFRVPDMRGLFLRGVDDGAGRDSYAATRSTLNTGGNDKDNVGSYQIDGNKTHNHSGWTSATGAHTHNYTHPFAASGTAKDVGYINGNVASKANEYPDANGGTSTSAGNHSHTINSDGDLEARPKNVGVYYIIKY